MNDTTNNQGKQISIIAYILLCFVGISIIIGFITLARTPKPDTATANASSINSLWAQGVADRFSSGIALITINGVIAFDSDDSPLILGERGAAGIIKTIDKLRTDYKNIKGVVIRVNSPGGTVAASQEIAAALQRLKEERDMPIFASYADVAASGGYYVTAQVDTIYANQGTLTGSIGVIIKTLHFKGLFDKLGISATTIKSGEFKDILSSSRAPTSVELRMLQKIIDNSYSAFYHVVQEGRGLTDRQMKNVADGRIFTGEQAKKVGLVDEIGTLHDALDACAAQAGLSDDYKIIRIQHSPFEEIMGEMHALFSPLSKQVMNEISGDAYRAPVQYLYLP